MQIIFIEPESRVYRTFDNTCCHFPFKYKNVIYNQCKKVDEEATWCSTDVSNSEHIYNGEDEYCEETGKCIEFHSQIQKQDKGIYN